MILTIYFFINIDDVKSKIFMNKYIKKFYILDEFVIHIKLYLFIINLKG